MSGAAGHLKHLHENRSLTFDELIEVLTLAAQGRLEQVTEKFDGINVVFTWNDETDSVRIARNSADIVQGGMSANTLAERFKGRGPIAAAFQQAYMVLQQAIVSLPRSDIRYLFNGGTIWYSAEIIYPSGASTINYDRNCIVFHGHPIFDVRNGIRKVSVYSDMVDTLSSHINQMQDAVKLRGWSLMGPRMVKLHSVLDNVALDKAINAIDSALTEAGVSRSATVLQYLEAMAFERGKALGLNDTVARQLALRLTNNPKAPNITDLKRLAPGKSQQLADLVSRDKELVADFIRPIEVAISDLTCEVLRGMHSMLVADPNQELERLRSEVDSAIDAIRETGDIEKIVSLEKQLMKLHSTASITAAIEGVVFVYKGNAYKLTGAWAPAHQIISLYRRSSKQ